SACEGLGGTLGAITVGMMASERTLFRFYYFGTFALPLLMLGLSLHLTAASSIGVLLAMGVAASCFSSTQYGLIYVMAPAEIRGRATGILSIFISSAMFGHYHAGILFERLGSATAMTVMGLEGAVAMVLLGIMWLRATRSETT
ncbi:MAG: hypothetical protein J0H62_04150, partial [Rhizobiales bacterium]|nr:hypothetical protein [Hyphomicrobiales bacterium]